LIGQATANDQPGTFVSGRWDVTNSSKSDVIILKARLGNYATSFINVSTHHPEDEREIFGKFPVLYAPKTTLIVGHKAEQDALWLNLAFKERSKPAK